MADSPSTTGPVTVPVDIALQLLGMGYKYLDVRTTEEYAKGHVEGAINIPYMFKTDAGMVKNSNFLDDVIKTFNKDESIIVACQSGRRSLMAATDLVAEDFTGVKDMGGGFGAWVQHGYHTTVS